MANDGIVHIRKGARPVILDAVIPDPGEHLVRCGKCGSTRMAMFAKVDREGQAHVHKLVCDTCGRGTRIVQGAIERPGKLTTPGG